MKSDEIWNNIKGVWNKVEAEIEDAEKGIQQVCKKYKL